MNMYCRFFFIGLIVYGLPSSTYESGTARADFYDLTADFSNTNNPNSVWSFRQGGGLLTHFPQPGDSNALNAAAANGYWGVGNNFNTFTPFVLMVTQNGSATAGYNNGDFLSGDVIVHSSNSSSEVFINWTAPSNGILSYFGSIWYAHSIVNRSNDFTLTLNGVTRNVGTIDNSSNRNARSFFNSGGWLSVTAGDVIELSIFKSNNQSVGSLTGIDFGIDLIPVPEPCTGLLFCMAGLILISSRRRNRIFHTR